MGAALLLGLLIYGCIGLGLATASLAIAKPRRTIDLIAERHGMGNRYAYAIWLLSTIVAWPIGLYVLTTGRLLLVCHLPRTFRSGRPTPVTERVIGSAKP